jgi:hypothetical protein
MFKARRCSLLAAAGIDCAPTTVKVSGDQLRINLHSQMVLSVTWGLR